MFQINIICWSLPKIFIWYGLYFLWSWIYLERNRSSSSLWCSTSLYL